MVDQAVKLFLEIVKKTASVCFFFRLKEKARYRMKVVDGALKVAHEAVYVSYGSVGGGMLGD